MEDTRSYEALSKGDEPSGEVWSPKGQPRALTHQRVEDWLPKFLPLVDRSAADELNGGDISPTRVVIGEVAKKVCRR